MPKVLACVTLIVVATLGAFANGKGEVTQQPSPPKNELDANIIKVIEAVDAKLPSSAGIVALSKRVDYRLQLKDGSVKTVPVWYQVFLARSVKVTGEDVSVVHPVDTRRWAVKVSIGVDRTSLPLVKGIPVIFADGDGKTDEQLMMSYVGKYEGIEGAKALPAKYFPVESSDKVFQNFSWFVPTDRSVQISDFTKEQIPALTTDINAQIGKTITKDEPFVLKELETSYGAVTVTRIPDSTK